MPNSILTIDQIRELAEQYLVPLFSGAKILKKVEKSTPRQGRIAIKNLQTIAFKLKDDDTEKLLLKRSQYFDVSQNRLSEKSVVASFLDVIDELEQAINDDKLSEDIKRSIPRRIVASCLSKERESRSALSSVLDCFLNWESKLYEGKPITAAVGVRDSNTRYNTVTLLEIEKKDFGAIINTKDMKLIGHESLGHPTNIPSFSPFRYCAIANWAKSRGTAVVLNRVGEILIFQKSNLVFARRSARWHFLTHETILQQLRYPQDINIRRKIYETCLDASFARSGACIGVIDKKHLNSLVHKDDFLEAQNVKSKAINNIINKRKFHKLDRRLRQELVAIDGATLLDPSGKILTVGAILKIPGGSSGGGRLAAARALGKMKLGIKISQDGGIIAFRKGQKNIPVVSVMGKD
jgi:hypothetical protein